MNRIAESTLRRLTKNAMYNLIREYDEKLYKLEVEYDLLKVDYEVLEDELNKERIERGKHDPN